MLTLENIKNWLKTQTDVGDGIAVGRIDGGKDRFLGVYDRPVPGGQRICLGGPAQTRVQEKRVRLLIHWAKDAVQAEAKALAVYGLLYGLTGATMDGARVYAADPGAAPLPVGCDERGIFEYVIDVTLLYERMD